MSIKEEILEKYYAIFSEKEKIIFLNEIITVLHEINSKVISDLLADGIVSNERATSKESMIDNLLKQIIENLRENIKLDSLAKQVKELESVKNENDNLRTKIERAQGLIDESNLEVEKVRKATCNELKNKLQLGRDRVISIAETTSILGEQINSDNERSQMMVNVNNLRANLELLTKELSSLGLWDENEIKPDTTPLELKIVEKSKKKKATKTAKNKTKSSEENLVGEEIDSLEI